MVAAGDVVFALTLSGVCAAFRGSERLCFVNVTPDEVIRSVFYNKVAQALITVSVYREDNFSCLKCRSTPIECIRRGRSDQGVPVFTSEQLRWPGFVEFDDVNAMVLTYDSAVGQQYRVWSMVDYELLYSLPRASVTEVKISPGIMLLIHAREGSYVPLKIVSIEDGTELKSFSHLIHRAKKVEFIEQFNEKLLVKQEGENLEIVDVHSGGVVRVDQTEFVTPSAFIFLYENNLFLTFRGRQVMVWNFAGEPVNVFEDHSLWHADTNTSNVFITSAQDYIISYCRPRVARVVADSDDASSQEGEASLLAATISDSDESPSTEEAMTTPPHHDELTAVVRTGDGDTADRPRRGAIHVSHILSGKCVARLGDDANFDMGDVTAVHFSEDRHELYVGNRDGLVHVWSQ